jgi:hypothetical protein
MAVVEEFRGRPVPRAAINQEISDRVDRMLATDGWFVTCGITRERIPYVELRYWNVEKQIAYARPELVVQEHFGY